MTITKAIGLLEDLAGFCAEIRETFLDRMPPAGRTVTASRIS